MLFILDKTNKYHRILRRGIVIGVFAFLSVILQDVIPISPEWVIPIITAVLAMIDKSSRALKLENK